MRSWLILIVFCLAISCSKSDNELSEISKLVLSKEQISDSLNIAYYNNSVQKFESLLNFWNSEITALSISEINDSGSINVYEVFQEIFTPFNLSRFSSRNECSELYTDLQWIVVQNKVYYDLSFENDEIFYSDSLIDFRPELNFRNAKTLYLTSSYSDAIKSFLGNEFNFTELIGMRDNLLPVDESYNRMVFFNNSLSILPDQQGGWFLETHPYISTIHFNKTMQRALVNFRVGYMFGEALVEKTNGKWMLIFSEVQSIE